MDFLEETIRQNGVWFGFLLAIQITAVFVMIERIYALLFLRKPTQKLLAYDFEQDIAHGRMNDVIDRALQLGERNPLGGIVATGSQAAIDLGGNDEIRARMEEKLFHEKLKFEKHIHFLLIAAKSAIFLGILGGLVVLIQSLHQIAGFADPGLALPNILLALAAALAIAALGLVVAIPCTVAHSLLKSRADRLSKDLEQATMKVNNWLAYSYRIVPPQKLKLGSTIGGS